MKLVPFSFFFLAQVSARISYFCGWEEEHVGLDLVSFLCSQWHEDFQFQSSRTPGLGTACGKRRMMQRLFKVGCDSIHPCPSLCETPPLARPLPLQQALTSGHTDPKGKSSSHGLLNQMITLPWSYHKN